MQPRKDWIFICFFNCFSLLLLIAVELKALATGEWASRLRNRFAQERLEE
jgi:hypothetical protein